MVLLAYYFLRAWPYCYLFLPSCLVLLLPIRSSFTLGPIVARSLLCTLPYFYMFHPSCLALMLHAPSFMFHLTTACSFLRASPCWCLLLPSCLTLLLPPHSFVLHLATTCSLLCPLPCCLPIPSRLILLFQPKVLLLFPPPCCFTTCSFTFCHVACLVSTNNLPPPLPPFSFVLVKELGASMDWKTSSTW